MCVPMTLVAFGPDRVFGDGRFTRTVAHHAPPHAVAGGRRPVRTGINAQSRGLQLVQVAAPGKCAQVNDPSGSGLRVGTHRCRS